VSLSFHAAQKPIETRRGLPAIPAICTAATSKAKPDVDGLDVIG